MKNTVMRLTTGLLLAANLIAPAAAETAVRQEIEMGVQSVSQNVPEAKFEEYGERPNGVVVDGYNLDVEAENYDLSLDVNRLTRNDQSAELNYDRKGKVWFNASHVQTPHLWSNTATTLYNEVSPGVLRLPDGMQGAGGSTNATWGTVMSSTFTGLAHTQPLYVKGDKAAINLGFAPAAGWSVNLDLSQEKKAGHQMSTFALGRNYALEFARTVDQTVYDSALGVAYAGKCLSWGLRYGFNSFKNEVESLLWDNFRSATDSTGNTGTGIGPSQGQGALQPDNVAHNVTANVGLALSKKSRLDADVSYTLMSQNADLLPHTVNTALTPNVLPSKSADAKNVLWVQNYRYSRQLSDKMALGVRARSEQLGDSSKHLDFGGHVGVDQTWSAGDWATHRFGYRKQSYGANLDWNLSSSLLFGVEAVNDVAQREMRNYKKSVENSAIGRLEFKPSTALSIRSRYTNAYRKAEEFEDEGIEMEGLRTWDIAARARNAGDLSIQGWKGSFSFGLSGGFANDQFNSGEGPTNSLTDVLSSTNVPYQYGVLYSHTATAGADLSWDLTERVGFFSSYQFQMIRAMQRSNQNGGTLDSDLPNVWTVRTTDRYDALGAGVDVKTTEKTKVQLAYDLSRSRGAMDYVITNSATLTTPPATVTTKQVMRVETDVKATQDVSWSLGYAHERYNVVDFANQNLSLTSGLTSQSNITLSDNSLDYKAHIVSAKVKIRW